MSSADAISGLPSAVKALVYLGQCDGVTAAFKSALQPLAGNSKVFGVYLMDEPDPTGKWSTLCPPANLKAESDWVHANLPGVKTFIIELNLSASRSPTYIGGYTPANTGIDLYGIDPYPCRSESGGSCTLAWITAGVNAAESAGIPRAEIVPVYQAFGSGSWVDDGGGSYSMPSPAQEAQLLQTWAAAVPSPAFDFAYSWGTQKGDESLSSDGALQSVFAQHNSG